MERLDSLLVKKGLVDSRTRGEYEIKNGNVFVDGIAVFKPGKKYDENIEITLKNKFDYVSKGALKLLKAIEVFNINLVGKVMLDIGSSTGGFSDVALRNNIKKIIAVDVGKNQFNKSLKQDKRIELHEETDFRALDISENVDIATIDVSFISVTKLIQKLNQINSLEEVMLLIKPQFECGKEIADKYKGVPLDKKVHKDIIKKIISEFKIIGFNILDLTFSPIKGGSGNIEYLAYFKRKIIKEEENYNKKEEIKIEKIVNQAFKDLNK